MVFFSPSLPLYLSLSLSLFLSLSVSLSLLPREFLEDFGTVVETRQDQIGPLFVHPSCLRVDNHVDDPLGSI